MLCCDSASVPFVTSRLLKNRSMEPVAVTHWGVTVQLAARGGAGRRLCRAGGYWGQSGLGTAAMGYTVDIRKKERKRYAMPCTATVTGGVMDQQEIDAYIQRVVEKFGREPRHIDIKLDGEEVELLYDYGAQSFQRIRRITGYLVGTLERFNNGKRAEESDRIKHRLNG